MKFGGFRVFKMKMQKYFRLWQIKVTIERKVALGREFIYVLRQVNY
jgi:hypothetical protein